MSSTLYTLPDDALSIRYRQPYISAGLNAKLQAVASTGIYSGLTLSSSSSAMTVVVASGYAAIASSADPQYQVAVHSAGAISLNLVSLANKTVAVTLEAYYQYPGTTTATFKAYDLAVEAPPSSACILGQVAVPAVSSVIPTANINLKSRSFSWDSRGRDAVPMISVQKNGDFRLAVTGQVPAFWNPTGLEGLFTTNPSAGFSLSSAVQADAVSLAGQDRELRQYCALSISPARSRVRFRIAYKPIQIPLTGNPLAYVAFNNASNGATVGVLTIPLTATSTTGYTYYEVSEDTYSLFSGMWANEGVTLDIIGISLNNATYASIGPAFYVAALDLAIETATSESSALPEMTGEKRLTKLTLVDPGNYWVTADSAWFTYDAALDAVTLAGSGTDGPSLIISDSLTVAKNLTVTQDANISGGLTVTSKINADGGVGLSSSGGTLAIGNDGLANAIEIATAASVSGGISIGFIGDTLTIYSNLVLAGSVAVSNVDSATVGGTVTVGATNAGTVLIGRAPSSGLTTLTVVSREVYIGNDADTLTIQIGNTAPVSSRSLILGVTAAGQTTQLLGASVTVGASSGTNAVAVYGSTLTLGHPTFTSTTDLQGVTIRVGNNTNTTTLEIGRTGFTANVLGTLDVAETLIARPATAADIGLKIIGAPTQSVNLAAWYDSASTQLGGISSGGSLLVASYVDRLTAGTLQLGPTNATKVQAASAANTYFLAGPIDVTPSSASECVLRLGRTASCFMAVYDGTHMGIFGVGTGSSSGGYIGTQSASSFYIRTNNTNRITIDQSGVATFAYPINTTSITASGAIYANVAIGRSTAGELVIGSDYLTSTSIRIGQTSGLIPADAQPISIGHPGSVTTVNGTLRSAVKLYVQNVDAPGRILPTCFALVRLDPTVPLAVRNSTWDTWPLYDVSTDLVRGGILTNTTTDTIESIPQGIYQVTVSLNARFNIPGFNASISELVLRVAPGTDTTAYGLYKVLPSTDGPSWYNGAVLSISFTGMIVVANTATGSISLQFGTFSNANQFGFDTISGTLNSSTVVGHCTIALTRIGSTAS